MKVNFLGLKIIKPKRPGDRHLKGRTLRVSDECYQAIKDAADTDKKTLKAETEFLIGQILYLRSLIRKAVTQHSGRDFQQQTFQEQFRSDVLNAMLKNEQIQEQGSLTTKSHTPRRQHD